MASVRDVPDLSWDVVSFRSCHCYHAVFGPKKCDIGPILKAISKTFYYVYNLLAWPDPISPITISGRGEQEKPY